MRLIDADALIDTIEGHVTTMSVCSTTIESCAKIEMKRTCISDVANAPTIDAIPVEWLQRRRDIYLKAYHAGHESEIHTAAILNDTLMAWHKEREAR